MSKSFHSNFLLYGIGIKAEFDLTDDSIWTILVIESFIYIV